MLEHTNHFLIILLLGVLAATSKVIARVWPETRSVANLNQWTLIIFSPVVALPLAMKELSIHLYWMYFVLVVLSSIWIGIAVYNGYRQDTQWYRPYTFAFISMVVVLVIIGWLLHRSLQYIPL